MSETYAQILFETMLRLDDVWGRGEIPELVSFTATTVSYTILKALQAGGWNTYFDPEANCRKLVRRDGYL